MSKESERKRSPAPGKQLKERLEDFVQDILDALGSLVTPEPELIPIPVRGRPRPYRR
jgi:hypothetical protein